MPEEMLRDLMISKGVDKVDKAVNKRAAWKKVIEEYDGEDYFIPNSWLTKKVYGKTIYELLGIKKSPMPEEMLRDLMISKGVDKAVNKKAAWKKVIEEYDGEDYYIPCEVSTKDIYGKTIYELLGIKKLSPMPEEMLRDLMISKGVDKASNKTDAWKKVIEEYDGEDYYIPCDGRSIYGKSMYELLGIKKLSPMPEEMLRDLMISKGVDKAINKKAAWKKVRKEYNGEDYFIPNSWLTKDLYGKTIYEILCGFSYSFKKYAIIINFLTLHVEDLAMMDKSELLQLSMLGDLPKEEHKKLMEFPKGEGKIEFIKEMVEHLKNSEEDQEKETFSEFLDEDVDESNKTSASKEETEFEKELHKGLEIIENSKSYNLEKQISDLFGGLDALGNFKNSDFTSEEAIDYIVSLEIQKLWNIVICNPTEAMKLIEEHMLQRGSSEFFGKVINEFLRQYNEVINFRIPDGYSFPFQPTLMQRLTAFMVLEKEQAANWSETGSGKTLSGVLSSRAIDSRITFVISVNSTINNWTDDAIKRAYPDSKIYRKSNITDTTILDRNFHNYVVVNYEEFQNSDKFLNKWKPFLTNNKVDFVILDEIQKVKANSRDSMTNRRIVIENLLQEIDKKHGRDLENDGRKVPILALSATPVINSVNEGLSIISLLRGIDYTSKRNTRKSALACHFDIVKMGLRLVEESPAIERLITFPIKRDVKDISGINVEGNKNFLVAIDICGCLIKIGECIRRGYLQPGIPTVIYTELVTDVIDPIIGFLQANNFRVGEFTGRNESTREIIKEDFIAGKYDILIASKPITTGVDGLQKVCNRIIPIVLPWTYAEYHQLIGRLNRKGTIFDEVQVIIPAIEYTNSDDEVWSLDNNRLARIHYKQILADVIMTGNIPDDIITTKQAYKLAEDKFLTFINNGGSSEKSREIPVQAAELKPAPPKSRPEGQGNQRDYFSEFQGINQRISTSTCNGVFSKIFKNKEDWENYHILREKATGSKQNQPLKIISQDFLKSKKHKIIGDMGCGMNQLKTLLPENYEVISVDMYAADDTVKVCNLMDTSKIIPNESLDIAVYCLSLWSRDWRGILKDAYRILDYDGKIIIVEPVSSSSKSIDKVRQTLIENGFTNISTTKDGEDKFYYMTANK
jgi:superfamily II DNA or RNA helicase